MKPYLMYPQIEVEMWLHFERSEHSGHCVTSKLVSTHSHIHQFLSHALLRLRPCPFRRTYVYGSQKVFISLNLSRLGNDKCIKILISYEGSAKLSHYIDLCSCVVSQLHINPQNHARRKGMILTNSCIPNLICGAIK